MQFSDEILSVLGEGVVGAVASITLAINLFGLVSVVKNFRRLRQRMYLFVISLTASNLMIGLIFLSDVIFELIAIGNDTGNSIESICDIKARDWEIAIESLKNISIILTSLNTLILIDSLHKRTTRMGRHREDTNSLFTNPSDGATSHQLPAFDKIMKIISLGMYHQRDEFEKRCESSTIYKQRILNGSDDNAHIKEKYEQKRLKTQNLFLGRCYGRNRKMNATSAFVFAPRTAKRGTSILNRHSSDGAIVRHNSSTQKTRQAILLISAVCFISIIFWVVSIITRFQHKQHREKSNVAAIATCPMRCNDYLLHKRLFLSADFQKTESMTITSKSFTSFEELKANQFDKDELNQFSNRSTNEPKEQLHCKGCSNYFYPLTKFQVGISLIVVSVTCLFMMYSSFRLLWLRRHSGNIFMRHSNLWRFVLCIGAFYTATSLPYLILSFADISSSEFGTSIEEFMKDLLPNRNENLTNDPLLTPQTPFSSANISFFDWKDTPPGSNLRSDLPQQICSTTFRKTLFYLFSCGILLLFNAFAPLAILLRLLGRRRLFSVL